jgi:perosamine synthetase
MIPVFEPNIGDDEINEVITALKRGEISGTFGQALTRFEQEFATYIGCKYGIAVSSGTTALHLAVAAAGIGRGDEVLVSSSTNVATALAVYHNNAVPIPVDSEEETWNLNLDLIEELISPRTRAIIPVHLYGHPVDMDRLMTIARKHDLLVIEDCAESHGAAVRTRKTGSFGDMNCFSFYANKIITTGEGGMVLTNNKEFAEKLQLLRNLAFTKPRFRHEVAGYNFRMTGYQAAMGLAQIQKIDQIIAEKRRVAHTYNQYLADIPELQLPVEREWAFNVYWMYGIVLRSGSRISRDIFADSLLKEGIETRTFFCPMNQQPFLQCAEGYRAIPCPVADRIWEDGLYLPSSTTLTEDTIEYISRSVQQVFNK